MGNQSISRTDILRQMMVSETIQELPDDNPNTSADLLVYNVNNFALQIKALRHKKEEIVEFTVNDNCAVTGEIHQCTREAFVEYYLPDENDTIVTDYEEMLQKVADMYELIFTDGAYQKTMFIQSFGRGLRRAI